MHRAYATLTAALALPRPVCPPECLTAPRCVSCAHPTLTAALASPRPVCLPECLTGQRVVPPAKAQPIYAAAPVLSAMWAYIVLSEPAS